MGSQIIRRLSLLSQYHRIFASIAYLAARWLFISRQMVSERVNLSLHIIGYAVSICMLLSPAQIVCRMLRQRAAGENSQWPFLATLLNCLLWMLYEVPSMHPHNMLLLIINCIGAFLELVYLTIVFVFSPYSRRVTILVMSVVALVLVSVLSAVILNRVHPLEKRLEVVGICCAISGILMYGSTIPSLVTAWKSNSTDDVSLPFVLVGFANCTIWLINAIIQDDLFMLIQNGCGVLVVLVQLAVYVTIRTCLSTSQSQAHSQAPSQAQSRAQSQAQ